MALDESFIFDIDVQIVNEESLTALRKELKEAREEHQRLRRSLRESTRAQLTEAQSSVNSSRRKVTAVNNEVSAMREKVKLDRQAEVSSGAFSRNAPKEVRALNRRVIALKANTAVQRRLNQEKVAEAQIAKFKSTGREDLVTDALRRQAGQRTIADVKREIDAKKKEEQQFFNFRIKEEQRAAKEAEKLAKQVASTKEKEQRRVIAEAKRLQREADAEALRQAKIKKRVETAALRERDRQAKLMARERNRQFGDDSQGIVEKQGRAKRTVEALRRQGREDLITESLRRQSGELKKQEGLAQRLLFTFRRLVGVLALFTIARVLTREFARMVGFGIQFADTIKGSEIAIGGIVTASTRLSDEFGNVLTGVDALTAAQGVARQELELLRQDALRTTATFEELVETFQIAVGPGLAAGGTLAEIRKLTVGISQAATAIGLPQNQLAEEVRSILAGTIQARTTRIATTLGITNEDIKRLKEAGTLFETLSERFAAFNVAAEKQARTTIGGIQALLRGALGEVLAQASGGLRGIILDQLTELLDGILLIKDEADNVSPNPQAVAVFKVIFDFLGEILLRLRSLASQLTFSEVIGALNTVRNSLRGVFAFAEGFATTLIASFRIIIGAIEQMSELLGGSVQDGLRFAGAMLAVKLLLPSILGGFTGILGLVGRINVGMALWFAAALAVTKVFQLLLQSTTGVEVGLVDTVQLISIGLANALNNVIPILQKIGFVYTKGFGAFLSQSVLEAKLLASQLKSVVAKGDGDSGRQQELAQEQLDIEKRISDLRRNSQKDFRTLSAQADAERLAREIELGKLANDILDKAKKGENGSASLNFDSEKIAKEFADAIDGALTGGLALSGANEIIRDLVTPLGELKNEAKDAEREFLKMASTIRTLDGTGAGTILQIFDKGSIATGKKLEASGRALTDLKKQLAAEDGATANSRAKILSLEKDIVDVEDARLQVARQQTIVSNAQAATQALALADELRGSAELARLNAQFALEDTLAPTNAKRAEIQATKELAVALLAARQEDQKRAQSIALLETLSEGFSGRQKQAVLDLIALEEERKGVEEQNFRARIARLEEEASRARALATDDLSAGVSVGLKQIVEELPTLAQTGAELIKQTVTGLGDFIGTTLVDAFDPTKDDTIKERFARFLQGLAQLLISSFAKLQIAKFFPTLAGGATGGEVQGGAFGGAVIGRSEGGPIPSGAKGVGSQPGFDPRDVVPALLRRNEFVVRPEVAKPNMAFLHALNSGQFLPHLLRSGMKTQGFATGGATSGGAPRTSVAAGGAGLAVLPAIAADEQTMDRMTSGGHAANMQYFADYASEINAVLGNL